MAVLFFWLMYRTTSDATERETIFLFEDAGTAEKVPFDDDYVEDQMDSESEIEDVFGGLPKRPTSTT